MGSCLRTGGAIVLLVISLFADGIWTKVGGQSQNPEIADLSQELPDSALFAMIVRSVEATEGRTLAVDPRALGGSADAAEGELRSRVLHGHPLALPRQRILQHMGFHTTNIVEDERCVFALGLVPPRLVPDSVVASNRERTLVRECEQKGPFQSIIVGLPRPDPAGVVVEVVEVTNNSRSVFEVVAKRMGNGWKIVETRKVHGIMS